MELQQIMEALRLEKDLQDHQSPTTNLTYKSYHQPMLLQHPLAIAKRFSMESQNGFPRSLRSLQPLTTAVGAQSHHLPGQKPGEGGYTHKYPQEGLGLRVRAQGTLQRFPPSPMAVVKVLLRRWFPEGPTVPSPAGLSPLGAGSTEAEHLPCTYT